MTESFKGLKMANQKKSKRDRAKYPALKRELNTKVRRYYIEPDYIDGVVNEKGEQVIRPLNDEEKAWLNKFYKEVIVTSFKKDGSDFYDKIEDQRALYRDNNKRNTCLYNHMQSTGRLKSLDISMYDKHFNDIVGHLDYEEVYIAKLEGRLDEIVDDIISKLEKNSKKSK